mmetsp:Transcript_150091/g.279767  ORF Transcript_150091/g.279767 Transcript_150091/m.279767 type:complete len:446 (-) Transcript_150091:98-1435(-)
MWGSKQDANTKFEPTAYNDPWFAIAFLAQVVAMMAWIGYAAATGKYSVVAGAADSGKAAALLQGFQHGFSKAPSAADSLQIFAIMALASLLLAIVLAAVWMFMLKTFPVRMTKMSLISLPVAWGVGSVIVMASGGNPLPSLLVFALTSFFVWMVWDRLEFTAKILKVVVKIYDKAPLVYAAAFATIALQATWLVVWTLAFIPVVNDESAGLAVFPLLLSLYWGMQVISNILYVSLAGVVARYYFGEQLEEAVPRSVGQACTNFFGSICFGSLLIAIVQTLREMARQAKEQASEDGNSTAAIAMCVVDCFLGCLETLVQIFNEFAFVYVAIYAIPFTDAAKKTYNLLTSSDALLKDNIANIVTLCGCVAVAVACAFFNGFAAWRAQLSEGFIVLSCVFGFFVGFAIMCVVSRIVEAGVTTMIVCFEEEPDKIDDELKIEFYERKRL